MLVTPVLVDLTVALVAVAMVLSPLKMSCRLKMLSGTAPFVCSFSPHLEDNCVINYDTICFFSVLMVKCSYVKK